MRFLISGYYGFGNLGDEALLGVIVRHLRERYPYAALDVLSAHPDETTRTYGVEATPRGDVRAVREAIARSDVVLSGGGGLLQNVTSLRSLVYYTSIVRRATARAKTTLIFAQSIGPLDAIGRQVVRFSCGGIAAATVRDERSRALLQSLLPAVKIQRTADPVFLLDSTDEDGDGPDVVLGRDSDPLVLVSVRPWARGGDVTERVAQAVDALAELGARVGFVPFAGPADAEACTVVMRACRSRPTLLPLDDVASAARLFQRARFVIGMRLHALILAVRFGVPFLAVSYDPKVSALCEDLTYPLPPLWSADRTHGAASPAALAVDAWSRREALGDVVRAGRARMRTLAAENFAVLDAVLQARKRPVGRRNEGMASA